MALQVGTLFSKLEIRTEGAEQALGQHHRALQQTAQQAGQTEQAVASIGQVIAGAGRQASAAAAQFEGVTVRAGKFEVAVDDLSADVKALNPELLKQARALADSGKEAGSAAGKVGTMGKSVDQAGKQAGSAGNIFQRLGQTISGAVGRILSIGNTMRGTGQSADGMARGVQSGSRSLRDMASASQQTEGALSRVGSMMSNIISVAVGFVTAQVAMRVFGAAASFVRESFIGMNDLIEQTSIAFTTMLGSAEAADKFLQDIADFAARTPFDFPGLLTAAQRMMAYGFSAQEVLPLLEDVGNASAALGAGAQGVDRMTLALGQMAAKGKVQTQELLQLTELGIPAFQLLADAVGVSTGEIQDMVSAGEISSDVFLRIFHEWAQANFGEMMEKQSRTFTGAMSNITDVLQMSVAKGLEPFFAVLRDGALRIAEFLETRRFEQWVSTLQQVSQAAVDAILAIPSTARAFRDWVAAILRDGDILNDFLSGLPAWFGGAVAAIDGMMRGAGMTAVRTYAQGIVDGASTYITQAVNYVADLIASYLVGQSPPPEGPLSEIDDAGRNLMETYTDGMVEGAKGAEDAAGRVADALDLVDERAQLDAGRAGLEAATGNLEQMEAVSADVEQKIKDIQREIAQIDLELAEIDRTAADINAKYDEQLEPLNEQLRLLEKQRDLQAEKLQLETDLARVQAQAAALEALGDPERRAEIAGEMALNDLQQQRLDNEQKIADIKAQLEGGGEELTAAERERLELRERDLELQRKETQAKLAGDKELTKLEKERLQLKLAQIDADLRANRAAQNATPEELTEAERQRLELQLRELELRGELLAMIDEEAAAQAEADTALIDARQREKDLIDDIADIQNEIAKIPILEEIEKVEEARRAELEPLELQRDLLVEQKGDLNYLRQHWQFLAGDVGTALEPLREAARLQEQIARDAEKAAKAGGGGGKGKAGEDGPGLALPEMPTWSEMFPEQDALEIPVEIVGADGDNLTLGMLGPEPESLGERFGRLFADGAFDRIGELFKQNIGRIIGASLGAGLVSLIPGIGPILAPVAGVIGGLIGGGVQEALEERGIDMSDLLAGLQDRVMPVLESFTGFLLDTVVPAVTRLSDWFSGEGSSTLSNWLDTARGVFDDYIMPALTRVANDILPAFREAWARIEPTIQPALRNIGRLIEWVRDLIDRHWGSIRSVIEPIWTAVARIVTDAIGQASRVIATVLAIIGGDWQTAWTNVKEFLRTTWELVRDIISNGVRLAQKFIDDALPVIWAKLKEWGGAFWAWIEPQIGPMIEELGKLLYRFGEWIVTDALPVIVEKLAEWGWAFISWIGPKIPELLEELGRLQAKLAAWIVETALPAIAEKLAEWGWAFINWVGPKIPELLEEAGKLLARLGNWIKDDAAPKLIEKLLTWGAAFLDWITDDVLPFIVEKAGEISEKLLTWITETALPEIKEKLLGWASAFLDFIKDDVLPFLPEKLGAILTSIKDWVTEKKDAAKELLVDLGDAIVDGFSGAIKTGLNLIIDLLNGFLETYNGLSFTTPGIDTPFGSIDEKTIGVPQIPTIPKLQRGGLTTGNTLAMLHDNEVVLPLGTHGVRALAAALTEAMQSMRINVPRVSSQMAMPLTAAGSHSRFFGERDREGRAGVQVTGDIVIPIYDRDGRLQEKYIVDVVNRHAERTY